MKPARASILYSFQFELPHVGYKEARGRVYARLAYSCGHGLTAVLRHQKWIDAILEHHGRAELDAVATRLFRPKG